MTWEKWVLIADFALGVAFVVLMIGKPRQPITPPVALITMLINAFMIALVVLA